MSMQTDEAVQYDGASGPTITIKHRHPVTGAQLATTGRLIAETLTELAVMVRSTPEVISIAMIDYRSDLPEPRCGACGIEAHGSPQECDLYEPTVTVTVNAEVRDSGWFHVRVDGQLAGVLHRTTSRVWWAYRIEPSSPIRCTTKAAAVAAITDRP